jgi:hypothetical protein
MFGLFKKDPVKQLEKEYSAKLEAARDAQRGGDIQGYAALSRAADELYRRLSELKAG